MKKITIQDILFLHPALSADEDVYRITTEDSSVLYLEVYANSDFGCEYTLYNDSYDDIDGGVVDECEIEDENIVAHLLLELLEDMGVCGIEISKLPFEKENEEENVSSFLEKAEERWKEKVKKSKRK